MFKFDFNVENTEDGNNLFWSNQDKDSTKITQTDLECLEATKIVPSDDPLLCPLSTSHNFTVTMVGNIEIQYLKPENIDSELVEDNATWNSYQKEKEHSDLIPGIYEGGGKIWECTDDVLSYMAANFNSDYFKHKRVLDLGCGAGLLGVYAMMQEAYVEFQDYNKEVLYNVTIPNVYANKTKLRPDSYHSTAFYSGDWSKYVELTKDDNKFDIIFTSETIYNPQNYNKLLDTFKAKLSKDGIVFLGSKIHYFGVGGGLREFETVLNEYKCFESKSVWSSFEGVRREILQINFKQ